MDEYNASAKSAKDWFTLIFHDDHFKQTKAQFDALDEATKSRVRAIFDD